MMNSKNKLTKRRRIGPATYRTYGHLADGRKNLYEELARGGGVELARGVGASAGGRGGASAGGGERFNLQFVLSHQTT